MKIAIVGKAGCGKTTVSKLFKNSGYDIYCVDENIHRIYELFKYFVPADYFDFFKKHFNEAMKDAFFNRQKLEEIVLKDATRRRILEDFLYKKLFRDTIKQKDNIIVDGILPRFTKDFDIVLYAHVKDSVRHQRLLKRGVSKKRIKEIDNIQKDFFKDLK